MKKKINKFDQLLEDLDLLEEGELGRGYAYMPGHEMISRQQTIKQPLTIEELLKSYKGVNKEHDAPKKFGHPLEIIVDDLARSYVNIQNISNKIKQAKKNAVYQEPDKQEALESLEDSLKQIKSHFKKVVEKLDNITL